MQMSPEALETFKQHALRSYPAEACGVLCGAVYVPCHNAAETPLRDFRISAKELAQIRAQHGKVTAVLHSHPYQANAAPQHPPEWPSGADMENWIKSRKPWGIAACDGEGVSKLLWLDDGDPEPLIGREFVWGVNDCYSLIRDWYRQERGIKLKNFARHWKFWERGAALYEDNFGAAGFVAVEASQVQVGDVVLMRYGTRTSAHGGIVTGTDQLLHHLWHKQSGYDSLHKWERLVTKYLHYVGDQTC
jgi:proteasome lid subunit RPN8/RPN11